MEKNLKDYLFYDHDKEKDASTLVVTYGISTGAAKRAVKDMREKGKKISLLVVKTMLPVSNEIIDIIDSYEKVVFAEENLNGQLESIYYGQRKIESHRRVNKMGSMITPLEIEKEANL